MTKLHALLQNAKECNDRNAKNGMSFYYADLLIQVIRLQAEAMRTAVGHEPLSGLEPTPISDAQKEIEKLLENV